ncbi:MAG: hypothetical protein AVDCRST_MAG68-1366, partial [uncultured Gemmatimonadetes bacterium]
GAGPSLSSNRSRSCRWAKHRAASGYSA